MNADQTTTADPAAALHAALITETRIAEALAQRSRGVIDTVDSLARRALAGAADIGDARRRLEILTRSLREGLAAGESAEAGDLRRLAETTLAAFEFGAGPRIAIDGPATVLAPEARRLVALALFDLASRAERFGALASPTGRVALDWWTLRGGGLRLTWREFGGTADAPRMRRGAGAPLLELLRQRFGGPLRIRATPGGIVAELTLPASDVLLLEGPVPRLALVAVDDVTLALTITALLFARGVAEVITAREPDEAWEAIAAQRFGLIVTDIPALADAAPDERPPVIRVLPADAPTPLAAGPVLRLPASASALSAAMAAALDAASRPGGAPS